MEENLLTVTKVELLSPNPSAFAQRLKFRVHYDAPNDVDDPMTWTATYLAPDETDHVLGTFVVGPVKAGSHCTDLAFFPPSEPGDGLAGLRMSCASQGQEFCHVGYCIHNDNKKCAVRDKPFITYRAPLGA